MGRTKGWRKSRENYLLEYRTELTLLAAGLSLRKVAKMTGRSLNTILKIRDICIKGARV